MPERYKPPHLGRGITEFQQPGFDFSCSTKHSATASEIRCWGVVGGKRLFLFFFLGRTTLAVYLAGVS